VTALASGAGHAFTECSLNRRTNGAFLLESGTQAMEAIAIERLAIRTEMLRRLYRYWDERRGNRRMPARRDIDPIDMPDLLPGLILVDVTDGERMRVRLAGTRVVDHYGSDYTSQWLDQIDFGDQRENVLADYERCRRDGEPQLGERYFYNRRGVHYQMERLILPLSDDGTTVNKLLSGLAFDPVREE